jgi:predicted Fe-S protein YdhL (DUF1289 family)
MHLKWLIMHINTIELIALKALEASDKGHFLPKNEAPVLSPCVGQCGLVPARTHCAGCLRTLDEIRVWSSASASVRLSIWRMVLVRAGLPPLLEQSAEFGFLQEEAV